MPSFSFVLFSFYSLKESTIKVWFSAFWKVKTVVEIDGSSFTETDCWFCSLSLLLRFSSSTQLSKLLLDHPFPNQHSSPHFVAPTSETLFFFFFFTRTSLFFQSLSLELQPHLMTQSCSLSLAVTEGLLTRSCTPFALSSSFYHAAATFPSFPL